MFNVKILGAAALLAIAPVLVSTSADAQFKGRGGVRAVYGGGGFNAGAAAARFNAGRGFVGRPAIAGRPSGFVGRPGFGGGGRRFIGPGIGFAAGALAGAALASRPYYGGYGYGYGPGYYGYTDPGYVVDNGYVEDEPVVAVPSQVSGDDDAYCRQRYRSYDPRSGTYLNNDGNRYPCP